MRQESGGVEAEVVIARAPRNGRRRCSVDDESADAVLVFELTRDGETGGARPDDNCVVAGGYLCGHWDLSVSNVSADCKPSENRAVWRTGASWSAATSTCGQPKYLASARWRPGGIRRSSVSTITAHGIGGGGGWRTSNCVNFLAARHSWTDPTPAVRAAVTISRPRTPAA